MLAGISFNGLTTHWAKLAALSVASIMLLVFFINLYHTVQFFRTPGITTFEHTSSDSVVKSRTASDITHWHLFGEPLNRLPKQATQLAQGDFQLRGIFVNNRTGNQAVIRLANGKEKIVTPGDHLPNGASVINILNDRMVIKTQGTLQVLLLPRERRKLAS